MKDLVIEAFNSLRDSVHNSVLNEFVTTKSTMDRHVEKYDFRIIPEDYDSHADYYWKFTEEHGIEEYIEHNGPVVEMVKNALALFAYCEVEAARAIAKSLSEKAPSVQYDKFVIAYRDKLGIAYTVALRNACRDCVRNMTLADVTTFISKQYAIWGDDDDFTTAEEKKYCCISAGNLVHEFYQLLDIASDKLVDKDVID